MIVAPRFAGKSVIVTGAASGIGRATMIRLTAEGGRVTGVDVNEAGLAESVALAQDAKGHGGQARSVTASIAEEAAVERVVADFVAAEGKLDVLVNMAGILRATNTHETSLEAFMQVLQVNLAGTFLFCREALPHLMKTKGNIVNAASTSSFFGHPYMAAYAASKGGVMAMTRTLAWEYIMKGVRVNAVAPGGIKTGMTALQGTRMPDNVDPTLFGHLLRPDHQMGEPENIAAVIAMLASEDGAFINGEVVRVDGGTHS